MSVVTDKSLQTSKRIDVASVAATIPAAKSSKETLPAVPRSKVFDQRRYIMKHRIKRWFMKNNELYYPGFLKIMEIPKGARHLLIQELQGTPHILGERKGFFSSMS